MVKRLSVAWFGLLFVFLFAHGAVTVAEQSVSTWKSGTLYFFDTGIEPEERTLVVTGYEGDPLMRQMVDKRVLEAYEYTLTDSPEGIVAYDIQLDDAFDGSKVDFIEIAIERTDAAYADDEDAAAESPLTALHQGLRWLTAGNAAREWFSTANGFQFVPDRLYLYSLQTTGVARRSVEVVGSFTVNPFAHGDVDTMFMQSMGVWNYDDRRRGLDDSDALFLVGGDNLNVTYTCWLPKGGQSRDGRPMYYMGEDVSGLGIGESVTLPLYEWPENGQAAAITVTKLAVLRDGPLSDTLTESFAEGDADIAFPGPIQWPDDAIGQIVVRKNGTNVRQGGSTSYNVVGKANGGDVFFAIGRSDSGWYAFEWADGQAAYIAPGMVEFTPRAR